MAENADAASQDDQNNLNDAESLGGSAAVDPDAEALVVEDEASQPSDLSNASDADGSELSTDGAENGDSEPASREDKLLDELQRLAAEYKNYRQRTESQVELERNRAAGRAAEKLFPVLDDLDRAEGHGDLVEGSAFATIASKVRAVAEGLGVEKFGAANEKFDPNVHEAVIQQPSADVTELTVGQVVEPGYRIGEVLLRAAKVVVLAPQD